MHDQGRAERDERVGAQPGRALQPLAFQANQGTEQGGHTQP